MKNLLSRPGLLAVLFFAAFLLFLGAGSFWHGGSGEKATVTAEGNSASIADKKQSVAPQGETRLSRDPAAGGDQSLAAFVARQPAPTPASLEGTRVDGGVRVDEHGDLVLEPSVRDMFEYYLATLGEVSLEEIRVWVAHYLNENLPARAARQGWQLFGRYLDYRRQLGEVPDPGPGADVDAMKTAIQARYGLRREVLGREAADAFFAFDEAYDRYMMTKMSLREDDSLTEAQRTRRLEQARAELPEPLQRMRAETTRPMRAREKVAQMRADGASEAEVRAWREATLGAAAADRLEALEERRREWQRRYRAYREERLRMELEGLAQADREAAIRRLREKHFAEEEIRRAEAQDRIREEQAGTRPDA